MNNFPDALAQFLKQNPDLPQGGEAVEGTPGEEAAPRSHPALTVSMERKGRGGKTATIISGFTLADDEIADIASRLKSRLGTGGSARGGEILIQGDRRDDVAAWLRAQGYKVKGVK